MGSPLALLKKAFSPGGSLFTGLLLFQAFASVALYRSNVKLLVSLQEIQDAGYLVVPNAVVMGNLDGFGPAFFGALFFTLTLGAALCMISLGAAWTWDRLFNRRRLMLPLFALIWIVALVVSVQHGGIPLFATLSVAFVSPLVFAVAAHGYWWRRERLSLRRLSPLAALMILAGFWVPVLSGGSFVDIRDNLLGRGNAGIALMEGYYRYTLYPTQILQSLDQRLLKTFRLNNFEDDRVKRALAETLLVRDYLLLEEGALPVDLIVRSGTEGMLFLGGETLPPVSVGLREFMVRPDSHLKEYAALTDRTGPFRNSIFYSLVLASPLLLYLSLFWLSVRLVRPFSPRKDDFSVAIASVPCLVTGTILLVLSLAGPSLPEKEHMPQLFQSTLSAHRTAALRAACERRVDIARDLEYGGYGERLETTPALERYWLARALRHSESKAARDDLLHLADDPLAIVSSRAFRALGKRGERDLMPEVLSRIRTNPHWYSQVDAYRALRIMGWKQELP